MKKLVLVFLACCGGTARHAPAIASTPAPPDSITIGSRPPAVGTKWRDEGDRSVDYATRARSSRHAESREVRTIEILKVDGAQVTARRVTFEQVRIAKVIDGEPTYAPSPLEGNTYLVESSADGVIVHGGSGGEVSPAEADLVRADAAAGDLHDRFARALAGKTLRRNEEVELAEDTVATLVADLPRGIRFTMTYRGFEDGLARFDIDIEGRATTDGKTMMIDEHGRYLVDPATGLHASLRLDGSFELGETEMTIMDESKQTPL